MAEAKPRKIKAVATLYKEKIPVMAKKIKELEATVTVDRKQIEELEKERENYLVQARLYCKNSDYYSGLLDKIAKSFGKDAFISDDGSVQDAPLRAKMPKLVADQTAMIERMKEGINRFGDIFVGCDECKKKVKQRIKILDEVLAAHKASTQERSER